MEEGRAAISGCLRLSALRSAGGDDGRCRQPAEILSQPNLSTLLDAYRKNT
jgi:hypothetical protein